MISRKPHVASSICLLATIFQNLEGTLWTHDVMWDGYMTGESGNKQKSYKIVKMQMFATFDKANRDTGNTGALNLAVVKHTTVQVSRLLL
jgi:hypothetical protein